MPASVVHLRAAVQMGGTISVASAATAVSAPHGFLTSCNCRCLAKAEIKIRPFVAVMFALVGRTDATLLCEDPLPLWSSAKLPQAEFRAAAAACLARRLRDSLAGAAAQATGDTNSLLEVQGELQRRARQLRHIVSCCDGLCWRLPCLLANAGIGCQEPCCRTIRIACGAVAAGAHVAGAAILTCPLRQCAGWAS